MREPRPLASFLTAAVLVAGTNLALAADGCDAFKWNVRHERMLFATRAEERLAGNTVVKAPMIFTDRLYRLRLAPQGEVTFAVPPGGRKPVRTGAHAGLVRLHIAAGGLYRISLEQHFWIDVVTADKAIDPVAHSGAPDCSAPHKILLYRLPAGDLLLQVSAWPSPQAELTVTRAPEGAATP